MAVSRSFHLTTVCIIQHSILLLHLSTVLNSLDLTEVDSDFDSVSKWFIEPILLLYKFKLAMVRTQ